MSIQDIFKKFVAQEEEGRYAIDKLFVKDGYLCATDSRIAVRCKTKEPDTEDGTKYPPLDRVFVDSQIKGKELKPLVKVDVTHEFGTCRECGGTGECNNCGQDHRCPDCDGEGANDKYSLKYVEIEPGTYVFAKYYLMMSELPNVKLYSPIEQYPRPFRFTFDGGEGCCMGVDQKNIEDDNISAK